MVASRCYDRGKPVSQPSEARRMNTSDNPNEAGPQVTTSAATPPRAMPSAPTIPEAPPPVPQRIGRHRVQSVLGEGGFGRVYLAWDGELQRRVALKVPHRRLRQSVPGHASVFLAEARTLA